MSETVVDIDPAELRATAAPSPRVARTEVDLAPVTNTTPWLRQAWHVVATATSRCRSGSSASPGCWCGWGDG